MVTIDNFNIGDKVRLMTNRYKSEGVSFSSIGKITFVWKHSKMLEVEFGNSLLTIFPTEVKSCMCDKA